MSPSPHSCPIIGKYEDIPQLVRIYPSLPHYDLFTRGRHHINLPYNRASLRAPSTFSSGKQRITRRQAKMSSIYQRSLYIPSLLLAIHNKHIDLLSAILLTLRNERGSVRVTDESSAHVALEKISP